MLARMQQFLTVGGVLLTIIWALAALSAGHTVWALGGLALLVCGYALVLAVEFVLLGLGHGDGDPTPRATVQQRLAAWWREVGAAPRVFCWRQPFRSQKHPDHLPLDGQGKRPVLFVHGFFCNRGLWNPWLSQLQADGTPYVALNLEPVFGSIDDYIGLIEQGVTALHSCTGRAPVIVAHSMGGLAVRRWWSEVGDDARVHHAITIGTPHRGTWLAKLAMSRNAQQMQQASAWLAQLQAQEPPGRASRFTCFYSHCDNIVFPPATATLPGADNRHLPGQPHVHMADRPEPWTELQHWLRT